MIKTLVKILDKCLYSSPGIKKTMQFLKRFGAGVTKLQKLQFDFLTKKQKLKTNQFQNMIYCVEAIK